MLEMEKNKPLSDETVFITGAARRLGREIAINAAKDGADIVIHYRDSKEDAQTLANLIKGYGRQAWILQSDLESTLHVQDLCQRAFSIADVSILVNNASIFRSESFFDTSLENWNQNQNINLRAPFLLCKAFADHFQRQSIGRIINMLDWRALRPGSDHFAYSISKAGLASMTQALALSLAPRITVNAIALGAILSPENEPGDPALLNKIPLSRWATLSEFNSALLYLLRGPVSLTGQIIHLDGGRNLTH
jgi:NAD(P)-dependent dehydrogenase (short-subunit alcohol dehydrogenase family)